MKKSSFFLGCDGKIQGVKKILLTVFSILMLVTSVSPAFAANSCTLLPNKATYSLSEPISLSASNIVVDNVQVNNNASGQYQLVLKRGASTNYTPVPGGGIQSGSMSSVSVGSAHAGAGEYEASIRGGSGFGEYIVCSTNFTVAAETTPSGDPYCSSGAISVSQNNNGYYLAGEPITITVDGSKTSNFAWYGEYYLRIQDELANRSLNRAITTGWNSTGALNGGSFTVAGLSAGRHEISIQGLDNAIMNNCVVYIDTCSQDNPTQFCSVESQPGLQLASFDYCMQVPAGAEREACQTCVGNGGPNESNKIYTAVGCIRVDEQGFAADLIRLLLGIAGGVALLSILAGAFIFSTSQGESGRVKQAKELITAAVSGLFFIIFSIIILDFIGVKILQIPGLG